MAPNKQDWNLVHSTFNHIHISSADDAAPTSPARLQLACRVSFQPDHPSTHDQRARQLHAQVMAARPAESARSLQCFCRRES
jgi:hypothetical protein